MKISLIFLVFLIQIITCDDSQDIKWGWAGGSDEVVTSVEKSTHIISSPLARQRSASWVDKDNNIWIFGGMRPDTELLNDLWKFDGTSWTLVKSFESTNTDPGAKQIGARQRSVSWVGSDGHLWLFGGLAHDVQNNKGLVNDLWKFDGEEWNMVTGIPLGNMVGEYGERGVAGPGFFPGGRAGSVGWSDGDGLYLFGGETIEAPPADIKIFNDLWVWNITTSMWTWLSGEKTGFSASEFGTKGVEDEKNMPGARMNSAAWKMNNGSDPYFYLLGGKQQDEAQQADWNDVWRYNVGNNKWTWVSGGNTAADQSIYGSKGIATDTTVPGARENPTVWVNPVNQQVWLFGGSGRNGAPAAPSTGFLNDLWLYNFTHWTWMSGSNVLYSKGEYGTLGIQSTDNIPGSRNHGLGFSLVSGDPNQKDGEWSLDLWFFGGYGYDSQSELGYLDDFWNITVPTVIIPPSPPFEFTNSIIVMMFLGGFFMIGLICAIFGGGFFVLLNMYERNSKRFTARIDGEDEDEDEDEGNDLGGAYYKPESESGEKRELLHSSKQ